MGAYLPNSLASMLPATAQCAHVRSAAVGFLRSVLTLSIILSAGTISAGDAVKANGAVSESAATGTAVSDTAVSDTAVSDTAVSDTAGSDTAGSDTAVSDTAGNQTDARNWIEKMSVAMQDLDYNGTFVYLHDGDIESMKISHRKINGVEHERLVSLNGEAREIIRNADDVVCIWPGSKSVIVSKSKPRTPFPRFDPAQMRTLQLHYQFKELSMARIANRPARTIDISPLDEHRYGYRLWIDRDTSLMLRSAMRNFNGEVLEQVMFTEIELEPEMLLDFFNVSARGKRYEWLASDDLQAHADPGIETDIANVRKMALPNGFELSSEQISLVAGSSKPARRLMYSDGLASLSVFVAEAGAESGDLVGLSTMGAVSAFGVHHGQWHVTVVGEVPVHTVKSVGESIALGAP